MTTDTPETANGHPALPEDERIVRMYWPCDHIPMTVFLPAIRELMSRMMVFQVGMDQPTDVEKFINQIQDAHYEACERNKS